MLVGDVVAVGALVAVALFYVGSHLFDEREDLAALVSHYCWESLRESVLEEIVRDARMAARFAGASVATAVTPSLT